MIQEYEKTQDTQFESIRRKVMLILNFIIFKYTKIVIKK